MIFLFTGGGVICNNKGNTKYFSGEYMHSDVELVKERINIIDIVGDYVKLTKSGANWKGLCPFHQEKTPSFTVHEEKQIYHCFGCAKGGDVLSFIMEIESMEFRESLELLAGKAGIELSGRRGDGAHREMKTRLKEINALAMQFYEKQLWDGIGKKNILPYLRDRGIDDASIKKFHLGYAPEGWRNLYDFLRTKGYTNEEVVASGNIIQKEGTNRFYDRFRERVMFPVSDAMGVIVGFSARVAPGGDESQAKYVNTPETILYHKSTTLYGIEHAKNAIKVEGKVLLVEGNMDVIAAHFAGIEYTVAVSGTALTEDHMRILSRYTDKILLLFDMDDAGQTAARKSAHLCFAHELQTRIVQLTGGKDAADVVQNDPKALLHSIDEAEDAMAFFVNSAQEHYDVHTPEGKRSAIDLVVDDLGYMENTIVREEWARKVATAFGVREDVIFDAIAQEKKIRPFEGQQAQEITHLPVHKLPEKESVQTRSAMLEEQVIGICFAFPKVWKDLANDRSQFDSLEVSQLQSVLKRGSDIEYSFDSYGQKYCDENTFVQLRALAHQSRLSVDVSEDPHEPEKIVAEYIDQLKIQEKKDAVEKIMLEMKQAEESGDTVLVTKLVKKLNELTKVE